ncbi:Uncharacterised protein [Candidatus Bilamarchaeum dharawalense]|uniref:Cardiolipin synthase N-terminal domain-containing protein n=1 Tax=Candidatus Bilamarchaeum dharawalense TaxID=2885759 RepID=A0A5E4LPH0_9ARCH|nr:Uncharacterised protein [Candidatus Bilamarchaeum dharawalense]
MIQLLPYMSSAAGAGAAAGLMGIMAGFYGVMMLIYCVVFLLALLFFVFWIWMLIDALTRKDFATDNEKLLWCLVVFLGHWLGAALYFFIVKNKKTPPTPSVQPTTPVQPVAKTAKK